MSGKNILITGGTSGLGFELAKLFCYNNYDVWITGRSLKAGLPEGMKLHFLRTDFSDLKKTAGVLDEVIRKGIKFDIVVNNAAVLGSSSYYVTKDGFEYIFQVNFLAHLLINDMILSCAETGQNVKLAIVTSPVYRYVRHHFSMPREEEFQSYSMYALSKYYLLLTGDYMKKKYKGINVSLVKFNPGIFRSGIYRMKQHWFQFLYGIAAPFMRSPEKPARIFYELIEGQSISDYRVYRNIRSGGIESPGLTEEAEKFLLSCGEAISILR
ncbi:MAG: SDR family NAD(P)-dependent oxidoreductase [Bacteroidales bacterium]